MNLCIKSNKITHLDKYINEGMIKTGGDKYGFLV